MKVAGRGCRADSLSDPGAGLGDGHGKYGITSHSTLAFAMPLPTAQA